MIYFEPDYIKFAACDAKRIFRNSSYYRWYGYHDCIQDILLEYCKSMNSGRFNPEKGTAWNFASKSAFLKANSRRKYFLSKTRDGEKINPRNHAEIPEVLKEQLVEIVDRFEELELKEEVKYLLSKIDKEDRELFVDSIVIGVTETAKKYNKPWWVISRKRKKLIEKLREK